MQAGGAQEVLRDDPDRATRSLASIERVAREGLGETRQLLGLIGVGAAAGDPQPTLARLEELVAGAREAGLDVRTDIEAGRRIVAAGDAPRVVMLTTFDLDEYVFGAFRAGASGFLLKDAPRRDIVAAVRTAAAGDALVAPSVTRRLIEHFAASGAPTPPDRPPPQLAELTPRELEG